MANNDDDDRFGERERDTANLRLRSLPAAQRTLLGVFAFVPYAWRGPLAITLVIAGTVLALRFAPSLFSWVATWGSKQP